MPLPAAVPLVIAGAGMAVSAGSAILGWITNNKGKAEADRILAEAMARYGNIDAPTLERVVAEQLGPTALAGIRTDPAYKQAQLNALSTLGEMEAGGGFTAEDRATLNRTMNRAARTEAGARSRITEEMAARGASGSGAEWAMMQAGAQSAADSANQTGLDVAGMAQKRYFDAVLARGEMGGQLRSQDWNEQAQVARANDEIARYNAASRERANYYNAALPQQDFENRRSLADRQYGMARDRANVAAGNAASSGQAIAGAGGAIGSGLMMYGGYLGNQNNWGVGAQGGPSATQPTTQAAPNSGFSTAQSATAGAVGVDQYGNPLDPNDPRFRGTY